MVRAKADLLAADLVEEERLEQDPAALAAVHLAGRPLPEDLVVVRAQAKALADRVEHLVERPAADVRIPSSIPRMARFPTPRRLARNPTT